MKRFLISICFVLFFLLIGDLNFTSAATPTSIPALPPCAQWVDKNLSPIPADDPRLRDEKTGAKCAEFNTAVGPISTTASGFIQKLFSIILSLSGGIALLLIILSAYKLMASQGNPEKLQGAKESLTAAIIGLLFIIFSLVILQFIGIDILHIPGLVER